MSLFSRKITSDTIIKTLEEFFDVGYASLVSGLKNNFKKQEIKIDTERDRELIAVSVFSIVQPVLTTLGESPITEEIVGKFQKNIFNKYFQKPEEKNKFGELFWKRCDEYSRTLDCADSKNLALQIGQVFVNHFLNAKEAGNHLAMMMFMGGCIVNHMVETKKFLNEILSRYELV